MMISFDLEYLAFAVERPFGPVDVIASVFELEQAAAEWARLEHAAVGTHMWYFVFVVLDE